MSGKESPQINNILDKRNERKYTVLSEFVANRHSFYLETMDVNISSLSELEEGQKMQKLMKAFTKKYPGLWNTFQGKEAYTGPLTEKQAVHALQKLCREVRKK